MLDQSVAPQRLTAKAALYAGLSIAAGLGIAGFSLGPVLKPKPIVGLRLDTPRPAPIPARSSSGSARLPRSMSATARDVQVAVESSRDGVVVVCQFGG